MQKPYEKLIVWQKGYEFVLTVYKATDTYPKHEIYGITSQLRRAAVSVINNIVEGSAKDTNKDFARFLNISKGSLWECECLLRLSKDLGYLKESDYEHLLELLNKTGYLLYKLKLSIK